MTSVVPPFAAFTASQQKCGRRAVRLGAAVTGDHENDLSSAMNEGDERIQAAASFVQQAPPGQINDVLNDVRVIVNDDETLEQGILPALRQYNLEQFITVEVPGTNHQTIVSDAAKIKADEEEEERFLDPRSKQSFKFDHLRLEAIDLKEEPDTEAEPLRAALESSALSYLNAHYYGGVAAVFSGTPNQFVVQVVANKYNPSNFWSGRWRSHYDIDFDNRTIRGRILLNIHYYEQGNVQLETSHDLVLPIPPALTNSAPASTAPKIFALIEVEESKLQESLRETYEEMNDKAFRSLRRVLPVTQCRFDWDKLPAYKIGAALSATKRVSTDS